MVGGVSSQGVATFTFLPQSPTLQHVVRVSHVASRVSYVLISCRSPQILNENHPGVDTAGVVYMSTYRSYSCFLRTIPGSNNSAPNYPLPPPPLVIPFFILTILVCMAVMYSCCLKCDTLGVNVFSATIL